MLKEVRIFGYKKFREYKVELDSGLNILVGDNESGKSTIIEAIELVINGRVPFKELSALKYYFTKDNIQDFRKSNTVENLPSIQIEIDFEINEDDSLRFQKYFGARYRSNILLNNYQNKKFGIMFECKPNMEYEEEITEYVADGQIPYEYYDLIWRTYQDIPLKNNIRKPLKLFTLDNTKSLDSYNVNRHAGNLFNKLKSEQEQKELKSQFYALSDEVLSEYLHINESQKFGLLLENTQFTKYLSVMDNDVLLDLKGKGKEREILTQLILERNEQVDIFIIEEPEMNLSMLSLNKLIESIDKKITDESPIKQMIITTHSNSVARKLDLRNIIYIGDRESLMFEQLDSTTAKYFLKLDNNNVIDVLNSQRNIIVEGAAEFILLPELFREYNISKYDEEQLNDQPPITLSEYGINITSGQGVTHEHYRNLLELRGNKSIFITDNDKKIERIYEIIDDECYNVISAQSTDDWTFEVAMYNSNVELIKSILQVEEDNRVTKIYKGEEMESKTLAYMLNHKTSVALKLSDYSSELVIPDYIVEAFKWIKS